MTEFHKVFSSCNRNFHQNGSHIAGRWCQDCPKCRFTALALAPFMTPLQLLEIQGADLLNQEPQLDGFKALCGLGAEKPFECVGCIDESRAAMRHLSRDPMWNTKVIVDALSECPGIFESAPLDTAPDFGEPHFIPSGLMAKLRAFF